MRGEALDRVAGELNVTAARLPNPCRGIRHSPRVLHLICEFSAPSLPQHTGTHDPGRNRARPAQFSPVEQNNFPVLSKHARLR